MKEINFRPHGICAHNIKVMVDDNDIIKSVSFSGGCDGNHKGLNALCVGRPAKEVSNVLSGIKCGFRDSSCPDQLSKALKENGY